MLFRSLVRLTVLETTAREIRCRVENDGVMKDKKGVNVPGVSLSMPYMSQRDREDILFGIRRASISLPPALSVPPPMSGRSGTFWIRTTPRSASLPRSKIRKVSATW